MAGPQSSAVIIGVTRVPAFTVALSLSIAAHAGTLAVLALTPSGRDASVALAPQLVHARGRLIRVRLAAGLEAEAGLAPVPSDDAARFVPPATDGADVPDVGAARANARPDALASAAAVDRVAPMIRPVVRPVASSPPSQAEITSRAHRARPAVHPEASAVAKVQTGRCAAPPGSDVAEVERVEQVEPRVARRGAPGDRPQPRGIDRGIAIVSLPQPEYPRRSVRLGHEGTALVEIAVRADGTVASVRLRASSGHRRLDDAALAAARRGSFSPALVAGRPAASVVIVPFEFRLAP